MGPAISYAGSSDSLRVGRLYAQVKLRGSPIGVVSVSRTTGDGFAETHARMLETFANHCAATVVKTHHHRELLNQVKKAA